MGIILIVLGAVWFVIAGVFVCALAAAGSRTCPEQGVACREFIFSEVHSEANPCVAISLYSPFLFPAKHEIPAT
jgi:hypothetical protein